MEPAARLPERLRHGWCLHDVDRQPESVDSVHDAGGACRRSRRAGNGEAESVSETARPMNRREAVKTTGVLLGGVLITSVNLTACARDSRTTGAGILSAEDQALVEEIADTLLPTTPNSPGAKGAGVGPVINLLLTDCRDPDEQKRVVDGLKQFRNTVGDHFASMSQPDR